MRRWAQKEYGYRNGELLLTADAPTGAGATNVALATSGGVASASSSYPSTPSEDDSPATTNNGDRKGKVSGIPSVWNSATGTFTQWLQIDFNGSKTIGEIDVVTIQDNWQNPSEPTEAMTFATYGITSYDVQYWDGSNWVTAPNGSVTGNNKVWRKFTFAAVTTSKVRVLTHASGDGYSRVAELEAWTASTAQLHWLVGDQLGTPRMVFDQSGSLTVLKQDGTYASGATRHDYLPFGEELFAGTGGRTTAQGYSASDGVRQKFTGYEADTETGLNFAQARYQSPAQGRFISPDPLLVSASAAAPQSWNRYAYAPNNPLRFIDPSGLTDGDPQRHWITDGNGNYRSLDEQQYNDYLNDTESERYPGWSSVDTGTVIGQLGYVVGPEGYQDSNSGLIGSTVSLGADGNFHSVTDSAYGEQFGQAFAPYGPALDTEMRIGMIVIGCFAGPTGEMGELTSLGLETSEATTTISTTTTPAFLGQESGAAIPVPEGAAGPTLTRSGNGLMFNNGAGGNGLASEVNSIRVMDATKQYPNGYVNYGKTMTDGSWQSIHPYTGKPISTSDWWWHIPR